ncbi:hypothetical protein [Streptomyces clavuligerus]|uniref:Holin n=1 Tax=Streptomyces clavuligerus TaxID=1901 RepID=B5GN36_STRCL|nr:hypothetical protein [Streptomyces clavuligerus]ANW22216.1 hypothetical protein BB341_28175 [Streptomyces clavuligerus]AXU17108.1 hypothetical protein D1794_31235 [Streptomyces clavuligerus]EDY47731.1 hypothetical protein SSCG_00760 [Streptomyces clavuligerus]EFG04278.1 Hypothetical protein SCLAV_p0791 [Streptomyces clavuligerus]MBY6307247.1 hypothetical protein [Streptomyces clavuligerus]
MKDTTKRPIRTVLQTAIGLAAMLPGIVEASGIPQTLPWVAGALAIAGAITRVMALPVVEAILTRLGLGLTPAPTPAAPAESQG